MKTLITLVTICVLGAHTTGCQPMHVDAQTTGSADAPLSNGGQPISNVHLAVDSKFGNIAGDVTEQNHQGWIQVLGWRHSMDRPVGVTTSSALGARSHTPIVIEKRVDRTSPVFTQAFVDGRSLDSWTLHVNQQGDAGQQQTFYTIELTDAMITKIETTTEYGVLIERISFVYTSITWTHLDGNTSATDFLAGGK